MNPQAAYERDAIIAELNAVIREIEASASRLGAEKGVGAEACMHALYTMANRYRTIRNRLGQIN